MINTDRMKNTFTWTEISISTFLDFYSELFLLRFFMFVIYFRTWYRRFNFVNNFCNHIKLYLMKREFPFTDSLFFPLLISEFFGAMVEVVVFTVFN